MKSFYKKIVSHSGIFRLVSFTFCVKLTGAVIAFLLQLLLARTLSSVEFGEYIVVFTWLNILMVVSTLGLDRLSIRVTSTTLINKDTNVYNGFHLGSIIVIIVAGVITAFIAFTINLFFSNPRLLNLFTIGLIALPLMSLTLFSASTLQGLKKPVYAEVTSQVIRQSLVLVTILIFILSHISMSTERALWILVGASTIAGSLGLFWLKKNQSYLNISTVGFSLKWIREAIPFVVITSSQLIRKNIDIIIVGFYLGPKQAGFYAAATRITNLISFGTGAINTVTSPIMAENFALKKFKALKMVVRQAGSLILLYASIAFIGIIFFGQAVLQLFGDDFQSVYHVLLVLAGSQVLNALFGPTGTLAAMTHSHNYSSKVIGIAAAFNVISNLIFVKYFGIMGAALTNILTNLLWNILLVVHLNKKIQINSIVFLSTKKFNT